MKFEFTLSIGYPGADHNDVIDIPDEELEGMSEDERTAYVEQEWQEWSRNFIDGGWKPMETDLFDMDSVAQDSPRLAAIKAEDVQTHYSPHMEDDPWLAIPMNAAREILAGYEPTKEETASVPAIMAGYCRLLDEAGLTFTGCTEREVQDLALSFVTQNNAI